MRKAARTVIWSSGGIASCALDVGRLCLALMAFKHTRAVARPHLLHRRRCTANLLRVGVGWGGGVCGAHRVCDHRTLRATCTYALVYLPHVLRNLSLQPCKKPMYVAREVYCASPHTQLTDSVNWRVMGALAWNSCRRNVAASSQMRTC